MLTMAPVHGGQGFGGSALNHQRARPRWRHSLNRLRPGRVSSDSIHEVSTCRSRTLRKANVVKESRIWRAYQRSIRMPRVSMLGARNIMWPCRQHGLGMSTQEKNVDNLVLEGCPPNSVEYDNELLGLRGPFSGSADRFRDFSVSISSPRLIPPRPSVPPFK